MRIVLRPYSWPLWFPLLLVTIIALLTVFAPAFARSGSTASCPLTVIGLLWSADDDDYTMFVKNPTHAAIPVTRLDLTVLIKPDTGDVPDPANERAVIIVIPTTQVAPMAVTPITFKADNINPQTTTGEYGAECAAV